MIFEEYRPLLLGLAYRLLGSMWDAEDVVQDAYLRWSAADRSDVAEPRAYLITIVSHLALDRLRAARTIREAYPGPWLPEPVAASDLGPLDTVELRDTLAYATLHMMERLTPPERAVFVLREAFELPYDQIAPIVGLSTAGCRQAHHRAARHLSGDGWLDPSPQDHARLVTAFADAARSGDLAALTEVIADQVTAWNDGGGKVRAATRPVVGRDRVLAFLRGLFTRYSMGPVEVVTVNGQPALATMIDGRPQVTAFAIRDGRVTALYTVLNPDKLQHAGLR